MIQIIKQHANIIKYIILVIFVLAFIYQCDRISGLKTEIKQVEIVASRNLNNYKASQDTIRTFKNQKGDLIGQISSFEFEVNNLSKENKELLRSYQNTLDVNEKLKNINSVISTKLQIQDSLINADSQIVYQDRDSIKIELNDYKKWDKYNWRRFDATIQLLKNDSMFSVNRSNIVLKEALSLKMAILKVDGLNELRISTPHPNVEFTQIENINLVNDKLNPALQQSKNWGIGVGIQYGLNLNNEQVINTGPAIGIGIYYSPNWLRW